jgi:hypothetical protein
LPFLSQFLALADKVVYAMSALRQQRPSSNCAKEDTMTSPVRDHGAARFQLKSGYQRFERPVRVISLPAAFITALTYQPASMLGWWRRWVESIGLASASYGTHSIRRTKAAQIYRKTVTCAQLNCS